MSLQRVYADDEEDLIPPARVVAGFEIKHSVDETLDVLHADGLGVQVDDGGSFVRQDGVVQRVIAMVRRGSSSSFGGRSRGASSSPSER